MATVAYTTPQAITRNQARLKRIHLMREVNAVGVETGNLLLEISASIGFFDGVNFIEHEVIYYSEIVTLATAVTYFGSGPVLATLEQKVLQRLQSAGRLPAGTVS